MSTILIAEDESHISHVLSMWLRQHGFEIRQARNGLEALEYLRNEGIDLLISDMNMPEMDGLQLASAVRTQLRLEIPIILLSARCDQAELAAELAPFDVRLYPKPFMPSRLVGEIERFLSVPAGK